MKTEYRSRPLDEALEKIEGYLMKNQLQPHTKLPSEREMSAMWELNRMTLRSAIQRLVAEGKLYSKTGSGTYVAEPKLIRNLQDGRSMTELLAAAGNRMGSKVLSFRVVPCSKGIASKLQMEQGEKVVELVRVRISNKRPLMLERAYLSADRFPDLKRFDFEEASLYEVLEREYGTLVSEGQETVGITYAGAEEAEQLKVQEHTALFFIDGVAWDHEKKPIEFFQSWIRADRIQLFSVLTR